jgi:ribosome maturation protein SDO1
MTQACKTPSNQLRHSNVAVVSMNKGRKRLEIACYKNKVVAYRSGAETRLDEVLQIDRVFTNVGRGEFAANDAIHAVLGKEFDEAKALMHILQHGELQVATGERNFAADELMKDACTLVAQKCCNPTTTRPYPVSMIEEAVRNMGISLRTDQSAKSQSLRLIRDLCKAQTIPIQRAQMRLRVVAAAGADACAAGLALDGVAVVPEPHSEGANTVIFCVDPDKFRNVNVWCSEQDEAAPAALTVVDYTVMDVSEGDAAAFDQLQSDTVFKATPLPDGFKPSTKAAQREAEAVVSAPAPSTKQDKKPAAESLATQLKGLGGDSDSDDGGRRGKKGKKGGKKGAAAAAAPAKAKAPAPKAAPKKAEDGSDSDEDFGSRRNRKKTTVVERRGDTDDDDFDYGEDDE